MSALMTANPSLARGIPGPTEATSGIRSACRRTALREQKLNRSVEGRHVRPHIVERDASFTIDQIRRVGQASVDLMDCPLHVVHEYRPGDLLLGAVALGVPQLLLETVVRRLVGAGMGLSDHNVQELDAIPEIVKELLQRLDRADRDRSGEGPKVEKDGAAPKFAQPHGAAVGAG